VGDVLLLKLQQCRESNDDFTRVWKWFHFQQETKVIKVKNFKTGNTIMCVLTKWRLHHRCSLNGHASTEEKEWMITTTHRLRLTRTYQFLTNYFTVVSGWNEHYSGRKRACNTDNKQINPRSKVLAAKLVVPQLGNKFSAFFGTRKFIATFKTRSPVFSNTICPCSSLNLGDKLLVHTKQAKLHVCILYFCLHIPREKMEPYKILNCMVGSPPRILPTL
jgi:hypothetical protein